MPADNGPIDPSRVEPLDALLDSAARAELLEREQHNSEHSPPEIGPFLTQLQAKIEATHRVPALARPGFVAALSVAALLLLGLTLHWVSDQTKNSGPNSSLQIAEIKNGSDFARDQEIIDDLPALEALIEAFGNELAQSNPTSDRNSSGEELTGWIESLSVLDELEGMDVEEVDAVLEMLLENNG